MTIKDILNKVKNVLPFIAFAVALDSNMMAKEARNHRIEETYNETITITNELQAKCDLLITNEPIKNKIIGLSTEASDHLDSIKNDYQILTNLTKRLQEPNLSAQEREFISRLIDHHANNQINALTKTNNALKELIDTSLSNKFNGNILDQINTFIENFRL
jgi:hypothetical protein